MPQTVALPLHSLVLSKQNVRKDLEAGQEDGGVDELAENIKKFGLLHAVTVRAAPNGKYEVIVGQRRLLACKTIGLDPVPCIVRNDLSDSDAATVSLVENVHRADMHPLDKANALKALFDQCGSYEVVAKEVNLSLATIRKYVALLSLPDEIRELIGTAEGPVKIGALSKLAGSFKGDEAVEVYGKIAGFGGRIQEEIIKHSGGDARAIDGLVMDAVEGAFDARRCGGKYGCEVIRDILEGELSESDFELMVRKAATTLNSPALSKPTFKNAAIAFWKALATS